MKFKIGDYVKCIDGNSTLRLTTGAVYKVIGYNEHQCLLVQSLENDTEYGDISRFVRHYNPTTKLSKVLYK